MTPQEGFEYLKANVTLPKGATISLQGEAIVFGNKDINFVLRGDLLSSEDTAILAVQKSLPHLAQAMEEFSASKAAAEKLDTQLKNDLALKRRTKRK